jgi:flagellar hook protein FlgE
MTFGTEMELEFDATGAVTGTTSYDMDFSGVLPFQGVKSTVGDSDSININFDNVTQYQKKTSTNATTVDGRKSGSITGFSVGGDGKITGRYSNGQSKLLGQISLAQFKNPAGLAKVGNNMFIETANSGAFNGVGVEPGTGGSGINSGVLEMSNVDLSKEFTEMITTQRGFQANSRIITASDEILQELVNLKR